MKTADAATAEGPQRIAKILARAGLCSRRDAERWIAEGRVSVDGRVLTTPAVTVGDSANIRVDGKPLPEPERVRLWRYHKPAGLVTTHRDEKGRPTVFAALPKELPRLISIGRGYDRLVGQAGRAYANDRSYAQKGFWDWSD